MAFITQTETKTLLQISASTWDSLITSLIPLAKRKIVRYCNNAFLDANIYIEAETIACVSGTPATITDSDSGFVDAGFVSGHDILVYGTDDNDGQYNAATVAAGTLTLLTGESLTSEDAGNEVLITRIKWPDELKLPASQLLAFLIQKQGKLVGSESLPGGYSVQYKDERALMAELFTDFRKPYR